jgi:hypothetical protein
MNYEDTYHVKGKNVVVYGYNNNEIEVYES